MTYEEFILEKAIVSRNVGIPKPSKINKKLFPFQQSIVRWALRKGRAAIFAGTGLGKTIQQCEWSKHVADFTNLPVVIFAPLAVASQTIAEAKKMLKLNIKFAHSQDDIGSHGLFITNYQKLDKFDCSVFGGVVLDESSILKGLDSKTKEKLIESFRDTPFRLACTATPAPNDYMELGNHAEFLGVMTASEMLSTFFVHDGGETQKWRLKGHAQSDFWKWMASWSVCLTHPRDLGFEMPGYDLPTLNIHEVIVDMEGTPLDGELFAMPARTLQERRSARKISIEDRVAKCAEIVSESPDDQWLIWCGLNSEAESCAKATDSENITGSDSDERKETMMLGFAAGDVSRIVSKVSICGFGLNFQLCHNMVFVGLNDSFEGMFQAIRRCWRFGQKHPVNVYIIISSLETEVLKNIKRKEQDAARMIKSMAEHMADFTSDQLTSATKRTTIKYSPSQTIQLPAFI